MNNFKFIGSVETTIDDKCRVTLPSKFRKKLEKPLKIEQVNGGLKIYESDDGIPLDASHRLQLGVDNVKYLNNRNIVMSGQSNYILVEDANKVRKLEDLTPQDISELYERIKLLNQQ